MIVHKLLAEILANRKENELTVVSICGAADLGKSYISKKISELLTESNIKTNHLTMDSYLLDREMRKKKELSGYDIEAYNQKEVLKDLIALKNGESINFKPYNHNKGTSGLIFSEMEPSDILIFDGLHSMHPSFVPYVNVTIFLYTKDVLLKNIRSEADIIKRKYTTDYSKSISESEFELYKSNVYPYKKQADYIIYLKDKWNYYLE
ncbi:hypothetical protein [uncultured Aquimarina sp.]|uniref:uridine kinase family protein n=1 Tax=uncultured Aquimarina sp. TaxID=575652 RepID=UPI00260FB3D6|nr:hypothetical protein [uncultured Aquimarina sp.]